jgi:hypothetical protein
LSLRRPMATRLPTRIGGATVPERRAIRGLFGGTFHIRERR